MSIITDGMVEKACRAYNGWDPQMRAALEAVAPDIIEACAKKALAERSEGAPWSSGGSCWFRNEEIAAFIRSLKSKP